MLLLILGLACRVVLERCLCLPSLFRLLLRRDLRKDMANFFFKIQIVVNPRIPCDRAAVFNRQQRSWLSPIHFGIALMMLDKEIAQLLESSVEDHLVYSAAALQSSNWLCSLYSISSDFIYATYNLLGTALWNERIPLA